VATTGTPEVITDQLFALDAEARIGIEPGRELKKGGKRKEYGGKKEKPNINELGNAVYERL
jgi:hypothetical protein